MPSRYSRQARQIAEQLRSDLAAFTRGVSAELTIALQARNPKDTFHSSFNWIPQIGSRYAGEAGARDPRSAVDPSVQKAALEAIAEFSLRSGGRTIHIGNNVFYLEALMRGSSSQAPAGWVEATIWDVAMTSEAIWKKYVSIPSPTITVE